MCLTSNYLLQVPCHRKLHGTQCLLSLNSSKSIWPQWDLYKLHCLLTIAACGTAALPLSQSLALVWAFFFILPKVNKSSAIEQTIVTGESVITYYSFLALLVLQNYEKSKVYNGRATAGQLRFSSDVGQPSSVRKGSSHKHCHFVYN